MSVSAMKSLLDAIILLAEKENTMEGNSIKQIAIEMSNKQEEK